MPQVDKEVLIYDADVRIYLGWYDGNHGWHTEDFTLDNVTHWQEYTLPEK